MTTTTSGVPEGSVRTSIADGVGTVEFSHPKGNSLPAKLLNELAAASGAWVTIIADSDKHGGRGGGPTLANPHSGSASQQPPRPSFPTY